MISAFARLGPNALGISCAVVAALFLFAVTAALLLKGAAHSAEFDAEVIGPHLRVLGYYLPGYDVTWGGACVGLAWGLLLGYAGGFMIASLLNFHHRVYLRIVNRGLRRSELLNG